MLPFIITCTYHQLTTSPVSIFPEVEASYSHGGQEEGSESTQEPTQLTQNKTTSNEDSQNSCCISEIQG